MINMEGIAFLKLVDFLSGAAIILYTFCVAAAVPGVERRDVTKEYRGQR
jgi:hypothetical protein